jgi:hypothetical protein
MKLRYITLFLITLSCLATAQTALEKPPLPSGPLLANPEYAKWQVTITQEPDKKKNDSSQASQETSAPAKSKVTINVTKTKNLRLELIEDSFAGKITKWCNGDWQLVSTTGEPDPTLYTKPDPDPAHNFFVSYAKSPFPEVASVSAQNYNGMQKVSGKDCMVFEGKVKVLSEYEIKDREVEARRTGNKTAILNPESSTTAFIDLETRLPVMFLKDKEVHMYEFAPQPSTMLEFPANIKELFELHRQERKMSTAMPARSY